jgi:hypothetical protein
MYRVLSPEFHCQPFHRACSRRAWPGFANELKLDDPLFGKYGFDASNPGTASTMMRPKFYAWLTARGLLGTP